MGFLTARADKHKLLEWQTNPLPFGMVFISAPLSRTALVPERVEGILYNI